MLTLKAFHIIFMVTWFAGLFYLPRLYIYHRAAEDRPSRERFETMEWRLWLIMTIGAGLTLISGLLLVALYWWPMPAWLHAKLVLVAGLIAFHAYCLRLNRLFREDRMPHSDRFLRWFNEAPAIALVGIVLLAVIKPF
ncbi:putative membrane protein [Natronospira proteinivora]|uniref:Protoporphyrinogen IX oxidase n=1 Tax=Natronospira proteinivora TaxID=1807133 RepID=A0ABT1GAX3_9GAMM|nr:CopD family protein [Natronospira proteinivora]MCP1728480.1 putative membrane protein [Natronospira proteinivora]